MNKRLKTGFPVVGACSLMTIFAVLCLITFALLSISTVQANERMSVKSREMFTDYYEAECKAEEILAQLRVYHSDAIFNNTINGDSNQSTDNDKTAPTPTQIASLPKSVSYENDIYSYTCSINDTQSLRVVIRFQGEGYQILRWNIVSDVTWEADESLPVWNGQ